MCIPHPLHSLVLSMPACTLCIHAYMHACMHACIHTCMYVCIHACTYAYMHACVYACMHACTQTDACMDANRPMHLQISSLEPGLLEHLPGLLLIPCMPCIGLYTDTHYTYVYTHIHNTYVYAHKLFLEHLPRLLLVHVKHICLCVYVCACTCLQRCSTHLDACRDAAHI